MYQALPLPDLFIDIPEQYVKTSSKAYKEYYVCQDASIIITEDTREKYYKSSYDYSVSALKEYQNLFPDLEYVRSGTFPTKCTYTVQTTEFNYSIGEGEEAGHLSCIIGYITDGQSMYIITCKCNTENYESRRAEFIQTLQSIAIAR